MTNQEELALRERVAVKLEVKWSPIADAYCYYCHGTGQIRNFHGDVVKQCACSQPPTLSELCGSMLKFLAKHTNELNFQFHTNNLGCDLWINNEESCVEDETDPIIALALAVDALEVE